MLNKYLQDTRRKTRQVGGCTGAGQLLLTRCGGRQLPDRSQRKLTGLHHGGSALHGRQNER